MKQKFPIEAVLSILIARRLYSHSAPDYELLEFLTGRPTDFDNFTKNAVIARPEIIRQHPKLGDDWMVIASAEFLRLLVSPECTNEKVNGYMPSVIKYMESKLGAKNLEFADPFIPDLANRIILTILRGCTRIKTIQRHKNLNGYSPAATLKCLGQMIEKGVIREANPGVFLLKRPAS